ncbi:MAG TPA: DoxX family protein [Vicinamibacterales bacterium]|jgi:thiosulfate dehydrogenase [quinone] large subunit
MALDRQGTGLAVVRIFIGVFFLSEGLGKWRWFVDSSLLAGQFAGWQRGVAAGSLAARYLNAIAIPGAWIFARLVPLGEITSGLALIFGVWTPLFAFIAFFMALNFQFASGALFKSSFLTSGYGLPVLGSTLGLAIGGVRLPWSVRS